MDGSVCEGIKKQSKQQQSKQRKDINLIVDILARLVEAFESQLLSFGGLFASAHCRNADLRLMFHSS